MPRGFDDLVRQPDYTVSRFGTDPFRPKSLLATIALALAGMQVLLARTGGRAGRRLCF